MTMTRKAAALVLTMAVVCAIALVGCGNSDASAGASSGTSESGSAVSEQQADEQAQPYVGTWKADKITLQLKSNSGSKDVDVDVPVVVELNDDMTGKFAVGTNVQEFEWEVREWDALKEERAVPTLHETFELKGLVCDPDHLMLEFTDSEDSLHLFYHWTSSTEHGVKLGIDTTVEKVS